MANILQIAGGVAVTKLYEHIFRAFSQDGHRQWVYVPCGDPALVNSNQTAIDNVRYSYYCVGDLLSRVVFFPKIRKHFEHIKATLPVSEIDYSYAHTVMSDGSIAYRLWKTNHTPYSVCVRSTDIAIFYKYFFFLRPLFRKILLHARYINFVSPSHQRQLMDRLSASFRKKIENKVQLVPNGIDDYWHQQSVKTRRRPEKEGIQLLFIGKIDANKNIDTLVAVVRHLNSMTPCTLTIAGAIDQAKMADFDRWKRQLGDKLVYKGHIKDQAALKEIYAAADIFIMVSHIETFGLVYIEAMSQALPVIYTYGQGIDGYFENGSVGYAVVPTHVQQIGDRIMAIMGNYSYHSAEALKQSDRFRWSNITSIYKSQLKA